MISPKGKFSKSQMTQQACQTKPSIFSWKTLSTLKEENEPSIHPQGARDFLLSDNYVISADQCDQSLICNKV